MRYRPELVTYEVDDMTINFLSMSLSPTKREGTRLSLEIDVHGCLTDDRVLDIKRAISEFCEENAKRENYEF